MRILIIPIILLFANSIFAQTLKGKVVIKNEKNGEDVEINASGAKLFWNNTNIMTMANPVGEFEIAIAPNQDTLIVKYKNLYNDTLIITDKSNFLLIKLERITKKQLTEIKFTKSRPAVEISYLTPSQQLTITKKELAKAACCNLSEAFETTPSVDVSYSDAVTGQKQIQLLGLSTPYTLITQENMPNIRGLASIAGLSYTPGTFVNGIQLTKGSGSVVNGYESLAGAINIELNKPDNSEALFLNGYQGSGGRSELNANLAKKWNEKLASGLMLHYKNTWHKQDMNKDGFMDNPLEQAKIGLYRMQYFATNGLEIQGGIKGIDMAQNGGSIIENTNNFNFEAKTNRLESWLKIGKSFKAKPWKSFGLQLSSFTHRQTLQTSNRQYQGNQDNFYANYIYQTIIKTSDHGIKLGASYLLDNYREKLVGQLNINRKESVPGIFAEYTYNYFEKLSAVFGLRYDYHNLYKGFVTPRVHLRYAPTPKNTFRATIGRAQRTANILTEQQGAFFSNRTFVFVGGDSIWTKGLLPEIAWNMGASYSREFKLNYRTGSIQLDYYYNTFTKQIIADYETPRMVYFYNLNGKSFAHSFQSQIDYEAIRKKLDIRLAYRWYDVQQNFRGTQISKPLLSAHRAFVNIAYKPRPSIFTDATFVINGSKRLANSFANHSVDTLYHISKSPSFVTINAQITKVWNKKFETYLGGENLTNFMQHDAIIGRENSANNLYFDATQVWGPIMGINGYIGFRYKVPQKVEAELTTK